MAAGYLSGGKIEYGLVPLGAFGLSIFSAWLACPAVTLGQSFVLLALLGFAGGFFIVPVAALLQHRPSRENKGQVQATANWLAFVGVFLASGAHWLLAQKLALSPRGIFLVGGVLTLLGAVYVLLLAARRAAAVRAVVRDEHRSTESASSGATISRPKAARCSSAIICPSPTRCCSSPPPTGPSVS